MMERNGNSRLWMAMEILYKTIRNFPVAKAQVTLVSQMLAL